MNTARMLHSQSVTPQIKQLLGVPPVFQRRLLMHLPNSESLLCMGIYQKIIAKFARLSTGRDLSVNYNPQGWRKIDYNAIALAKFCCELLLKTGMVEVVDKLDLAQIKIGVKSDFDPLKSVYVCFSHMLDWDRPINSEERANMKNKPDRLVAVLQHFNMIATLIAAGVKVYILDPKVAAQMKEKGVPLYPEITYTCDALKVIGNKIVRANMFDEVRQPETDLIANADITLDEIIEFGDVFLLEKDTCFATTGERTKMGAIETLKMMIGGTFHVAHKDKGSLHCDCILGPIPAAGSSGFLGAIVYLPSFIGDGALTNLLNGVFGTIHEISEDEMRLLGPNQVWLNRAVVLLHNACAESIKILTEHGKTAIGLNLSETCKGKGSMRCDTNALARG